MRSEGGIPMISSRIEKIKDNAKKLEHKLQLLDEMLHRSQHSMKGYWRSVRDSEAELKDIRLVKEALTHLLGSFEMIMTSQDALGQICEEADQLQSNLKAQDRERNQFAALYAVSQAINSSLDLKEQLDLLMDIIVEVTDAERGFVMMIDDETGELTLRVIRNIDPNNAAPYELEISESVAHRAADTGEAILTFNAQEDPRFQKMQSVADYSLRSILCVPLRVQNQTIGVIYLDNRARDNVFSPRERDLAVAFANQAAIAIEKAQLINNLETANERLIRADELKSKFITRISHELRTPMTGILGYLDLLLGGMAGSLDEQQRRFIEIIRKNAGRMNGLVNRVIDLSNVERGKFDLDISVVDLNQAIDKVFTELSPRFEARQLHFNLDLPETLPTVRGDEEKVSQIIAQLLDNASKFTPKGGKIELRARIGEMLENGYDFVQVSVQDNGIGIAPQDQPAVFDKFFRADNQLSIEAGGTGIGLAVAKALVEAHGGSMWLESVLDKGSTFYFTLPIAK